MRGPKAPKSQKSPSALLVATYNGYTMGGDYVSLKLEKPFNEYGDVVVICDQPVQKVVEVLNKLQSGDELMCSVARETVRSSKIFHLKSLARLDEPDSILLGKAESAAGVSE